MEPETESTPDLVARRFFEVIPPLWHAMTSVVRYGDHDGERASFPQVRAMAILHHQPASLNDLARLHEVSPATMSRMMSTLVERGWVCREGHPDDRRQISLTLTEDGERALDDIRNRSLDYLADMLTGLSGAELAELERSLSALGRVVAARREVSGKS